MNTNRVTEAVTHMLHADNETDRCLAIGELLDRMVRSIGQSADKIGPLAAAMLLLWRVDHDSVALGHAKWRASIAVQSGGFSAAELAKLATTGRTLMELALELQGKQLLAEVDAAPTEYVPQMDDLVVWLGKHIAKVVEVDSAEVVTDGEPVETITTVTILTAAARRIPISPKELTLYHRED